MNLFVSCVRLLFMSIFTMPAIAIANPTKNTYFPAAGFIISGAFAIFNIPVRPSIMIHPPMATMLSTRRPMSNKANKAISMNAVCFAMNAHANIVQEMMMYLRESRWSLSPCSRLSSTCFRKTNPERSANMVSAMTPRSVLLSTNTRNAPIPLVSRNKSIIRPLYMPSVVTVSSSSFFGEK